MAKVVSLEGKRKAPSLEPLLALCADDMGGSIARS
jgi:octaprenyl-diphosphate synthase